MLIRTALISLLAVNFVSGCKDPIADDVPFTQPVVLGGVAIAPDVLDNGRQMYVRHCRACHGFKGDGRGPSAPALRPAPRDLRLAKYKFTRMEDGDLPTDEALFEIVSEGLHGTAMLPWDIQHDAFMDIIHYIKTFSKEDDGWRDPENEVGKPLEISKDPWVGNDDEARKLGKKVFHGKANCQSCHPAYATKKYQWRAFKSYNMTPVFRDNMYMAKPTPTEPEEARSEYSVNGVEQWFKPPDYTWNPLRTVGDGGDTRQDLYRIIGAGVNGTAMARWKGTLEEKELWAVAYYVDHLQSLRDTPGAKKLRDRLADQKPWEPPAPTPEPEADPGANEG
jgi:mono/diheme cytochrome c family protein